MDYIINLSSQLREYLRALRKTRGLTQAELGRLIGVGQARMAEIEGNPAAVSVDQLMSVLGALQATLAIKTPQASPERDFRRPAQAMAKPPRLTATGAAAADRKRLRKASPKAQVQSASPRNSLSRAKKGSW